MSYDFIIDNRTIIWLRVIIASLLLLSFGEGYSQVFPSGSAGSVNQTRNSEAEFAEAALLLTTYYTETVVDPYSFREGKEYEIYFDPVFSSPLMMYRNSLSASLKMNGRSYDGLTLYYDSFIDEVVLPDFGRIGYTGQLGMITLNKSLIESITFHFPGRDMTLINMTFPDSLAWLLRDGFYEVKYNGVSKLLASHQSYKEIRTGRDYYNYRVLLYAFVDTRTFEVKKAGKLLRVLEEITPGSKRRLKFIRDNYSQTEEEKIIRMLTMYDEK